MIDKTFFCVLICLISTVMGSAEPPTGDGVSLTRRSRDVGEKNQDLSAAESSSSRYFNWNGGNGGYRPYNGGGYYPGTGNGYGYGYGYGSNYPGNGYGYGNNYPGYGYGNSYPNYGGGYGGSGGYPGGYGGYQGGYGNGYGNGYNGYGGTGYGYGTGYGNYGGTGYGGGYNSGYSSRTYYGTSPYNRNAYGSYSYKK